MDLTDAELDDAMTAALRILDMPRFEQLAGEADRRARELAARLDQPGTLLEAALWYAEQGMPVFPCRPGDKTPATAHGFKDATTDSEQIRRWWNATPAANIGLPTGGRYDVIDIDAPTGYHSLVQLKTERRIPDRYAGRVLTPRGGMHIYIQPTGSGNHTAIRPGIDYRGAGGYVLAPPSRSAAHGRRWEWCNPLSTTGYRTIHTGGSQ